MRALREGSGVFGGTFGGAVERLPLVVPLGLHVHLVVLAVGRVRGGVGAAVLVHGELAVRV